MTARGAGHAGPDGTEVVNSWQCVDECPVKMLDAMSAADSGRWPADPGGGTPSRFFPTFADRADLIAWLRNLVSPGGGATLQLGEIP
jgi:hypothetical protein